jgi:catechol 2,3-dioxygenase-like lactoylglutathione lyase family enzyme
MAPIAGLDHCAITVADIETTMNFYRDLFGCEILYEEQWRAGSIPVISMVFGANLINVHDAASPASPHARRPTPGSGDICFRWEGSIESAIQLLEQHAVEIVFGPVARPASDGRAAQSVYFRDPDDNLMELLAPNDG